MFSFHVARSTLFFHLTDVKTCCNRPGHTDAHTSRKPLSPADAFQSWVIKIFLPGSRYCTCTSLASWAHFKI